MTTIIKGVMGGGFKSTLQVFNKPFLVFTAHSSEGLNGPLRTPVSGMQACALRFAPCTLEYAWSPYESSHPPPHHHHHPRVAPPHPPAALMEPLDSNQIKSNLMSLAPTNIRHDIKEACKHQARQT